jgi:hypothetical protein
MSSDAFCVNAIFMMYEICVPFMKLGDDKINKIDATYIPSNSRIDLGTGDTPICTVKELKQPI